MKTLLPIGSVVMLKEGKKHLMIIGTHQKDKTGNLFDYVGVIHPEGYINSQMFFLFNQEDLDQIEFMGCVNAEVQVYRELLSRELDKEDSKPDKNVGKKNNKNKK